MCVSCFRSSYIQNAFVMVFCMHFEYRVPLLPEFTHSRQSFWIYIVSFSALHIKFKFFVYSVFTVIPKSFFAFWFPKNTNAYYFLVFRVVALQTNTPFNIFLLYVSHIRPSAENQKKHSFFGESTLLICIWCVRGCLYSVCWIRIKTSKAYIYLGLQISIFGYTTIKMAQQS